MRTTGAGSQLPQGKVNKVSKLSSSPLGSTKMKILDRSSFYIPKTDSINEDLYGALMSMEEMLPEIP
jgi:hypothetical protein